MPRFRKKPVEVSAFRFDKEVWRMGEASKDYHPGYNEIYWDEQAKWFRIDTLEGPMFVTDGDWIVTGVKGERYPVKPDIFEKTYERV